jgi:hypothetical protein
VDDHDVLNALYGTEAVLVATGEAIRHSDGYWFAGDHWEHRGVSAVLVVKNLHPAFVGRQHTIWEHPDPENPVNAFPMWQRSVVGVDGRMAFVEPDRTQANWFGLGDRWPVGEAFPEE